MQTTPSAVSIAVKANQPTGPFKPIWNWFGYDEPNYTNTEHGEKLLRELAAISETPVYIRTHNLLTSGNGVASLKWGSTNAYTQDSAGNPVYDWTIMDGIFDAYIKAGTIPFVQIGFTPEALSDDDGPYQHSWDPESKFSKITTGWTSPPNDLEKWGNLISAWAQHMADRYGHETVSSWPWEVWNEPDGLYWTGSIREFCDMYDVTAKALKKVLPNARVGGPHTCGAYQNENAAKFLREFLGYCVENKSPIDFIAFHAKGNPVIYKDHVRMGVRKHLNDIETNLAIMNEYPELKGLTAILGESDPEGCAACSARVHPQNNYRNGPLYGSYVIETIMRTYEISKNAGIEIEGAVTWAFMFNDQPYFDGFRDLATNGIDKAVLNAFRLLGKLNGSWLEATSNSALTTDHILKHGVRDNPDINVVATKDDQGISVLVWHYHDDNVVGTDAEISLAIDGVPGGSAKVSHFRMDEKHSNAFGVWKDMGSPQELSPDEYKKLESAGQLALMEEKDITIDDDGCVKMDTTLPRHGASLFRIDYT